MDLTFEVFEKLIIIIVNAIILLLTIIILGDSTKSKINVWFVIMTISIAGWVNCAYLGINVVDVEQSITFYRWNFFFVALFLYCIYVFFIYYFEFTRLEWIRKFILSISIAFASLSISTNKVIDTAIQREWGMEAIPGSLNDPFKIFSVLVALLVIYVAVSRYSYNKKQNERSAFYFLIGVSVLIFFNLVFNVLEAALSISQRYQNFGDYSAVFFLAFTAYTILRQKFLNVRVTFAAILIGVIGMLIIVDTFIFSDNLFEQVMRIIMLVFFLIISIVLIRSILNEQLQKEALTIKAHEQQDMMDVLAHEVKTPMSSMLLEAEFLENSVVKKKNKYNPKEISESIKAMQRAGHQGISIVNGLLEFTRVTNKRFKLNYSEFDLVETVDRSIKTFKKMIENGNYTINFKTKNSKLEIAADQSRIQEALEGLLINAKKYGINPETGHSNIEVTLQRSDDKKFAILSVKDNGIGLTDEDKTRLGQKFYRGKRQSNRSKSDLPAPGGTGLGLFMINIIMDAHKGYMSFDSEGVGKGSTFTLHIPLRASK